jgi:uncharacterized membrane protein YbhN (UPF0104 family)
MRRLLTFLIKAAVSAFLLYLSLRGVNLPSIKQRLGGLDLRWLAFSLFILCAQTFLLALRWREIALICGAKLRYSRALSYTFIGQFFSQVLPSTVGGDAARVWLLARGRAGWRIAIYSVFTDRVVGVSVLAVLVVACLPWTLNLIQDPTARAALALIGFGMVAGSIMFFALGATHLRAMERWWVTRHLAGASHVAWRLCRSVTGARVAAYSIVIHLMTVLAAWGAAIAAHADVDLVLVLFLVPPVILIATIPVSIAGWGVRESAMMLAFSFAGLAGTDGLIVSILFGIVTLVVGTIGGIVWLFDGYMWRLTKNAGIESVPRRGLRPG